MKRIGVILFTLLFVGVLVIVPCFASSASIYLELEENDSWDSNFGVDTDIYLVYGPSWVQHFYTNSANSFGFLVRPHVVDNESVFTFRICNNSSTSSLVINFSRNVLYELNSYSVTIYPNSYVDVTSVHIASDVEVGVIASVSSVSISDISYSVFNANGIIGNISNVFGMIFNSSTILLPLFLIGVTVSLGFVAIRYIRKVMWSR